MGFTVGSSLIYAVFMEKLVNLCNLCQENQVAFLSSLYLPPWTLRYPTACVVSFHCESFCDQCPRQQAGREGGCAGVRR
jgi:hypothetical protein